ncbi:tetratricopeptide repeat protein [Nannocystis radixulma]|uniref:Tetratricopeptide repeat protein n=1 Tax=Nannocystis radixulma TaxID=2995305 RepID=A0ABT5BK41_9BACT|nr:tetratricopeptide repeat protein [Nannocystis radixulma]MDC0674521.1 tetratricopeptide repeat protein [Nannocystis radixulma]
MAPGEPPELAAFRAKPSDDAFLRLRRAFREAENWSGLATLLVVHAAAITGPPKVGELCVQAYELWYDRVKDKPQAAYALVRALQAEPHNHRAFELLRKVYQEIGALDELATLLKFRLDHLRRNDRGAVPAALVELGKVDEQRCQVDEAIACYRAALDINHGERDAAEQLIRLHLQAGAWLRVIDLINAELARTDTVRERERFAALHLRLARIEAEQLENIPSAALHLQAALKANPDDVAALRAFGALYLGSGKASDEGLQKAADVFFRAAKLARSQGDDKIAYNLLRRAMSLRPDHHEAGNALAELLMAQEKWMELDDLYGAWIGYVTEADSYGLWLSRGELLETRLARREEARACYEQASRLERPGGDAWLRLEALLVELGDNHALVGLYERWSEQDPSSLPTDKLLWAARVAREDLGDEERAAVAFYRVLEREPFNHEAFEGYKEHWRRKNNWSHLAGLILYQVDQALQMGGGPDSPLARSEFAEHFVELAEIYERRLGDLAGALDAWNRLALAYPNDWRPRDQIARIDKRARMLDANLATLESELQRTVDPQRRFEVLRRLSQAHRERMTDPQRTIVLLQEMLALAPGHEGALRALAEMYERTGAYDQVIDLLRRQHDVTRSISQRVVLLRRMAELWQHELHSPREALWACEQILGYSPSDLDAVHRMQGLSSELGDAGGEYEALSRELQLVGEPAQRTRIIRRMADVADRKLQDPQRSAQAWTQLQAADPHNLEVTDKLIAAYEALGNREELANLLGKAASSARTPAIRQLDYLMRLGHVAEASLGDADLACSAFERALRIHRDHRGATEALTRLYRNLGSWHGLAASLGTLQEMADSDEEALGIGWERAEILADRLDNPAAAIRVLEQLASTSAVGHRDVALKLLELYERAGQYDRLIRQAEVLLLSALETDERRELFSLIARNYVVNLNQPQKAIAAFQRFMREEPDDSEGLKVLGELQTMAGDHQATLDTLAKRLESLTDAAQQVVTLEQMAEVCEYGLGHAKRALALLGRALGIAPGSRDLKTKIEGFAERHGMYKDLLVVYGERFTEMSGRAESRGQIDLCLGASATAEKKIGDADLAFAWARKAYFVALRAGLDAGPVLDRLEGLAQAHGLWPQMLEVSEQELAFQEKTPNYGDFGTIALLMSAAEIARERLGDPARSIGYLQRAYKLRPDDEDLGRQIEALAEAHKMWQALIDLQEARLARAKTGLGRFDPCTAIAKIYERHLDDPRRAFQWLRRAENDLRPADPSLAEEAAGLMTELAQRHQLWPELADHHRGLALAKLQRSERGGLNQLKDSARIDYEKRQDPLAALRTLRLGVAYDRDGAALMPAIEAMAAKVDENRSPDTPPTGALTLLSVTQQIIGQTVDPALKLQLLKRRAELRAGLGDTAGAIAEWLRALSLHPGSEEARFELDRLAERDNLWHLLLLAPAAELHFGTGKAQQGKLLTQIAELYENCLGRPEYALRARIAAWKLHGDLPPEKGELGPTHAKMWHLAGLTGTYLTPQPARDPLLWPQIAPPELADRDQWRKLGLDPDTLAPRVAKKVRSKEESSVVELDDIEEVSRPTTEILLSELEPLGDFRRGGAEVVARPGKGVASDTHTNIVDIAELEPIEASVATTTKIRPSRPARGETDIVDIAELEPVEASVSVSVRAAGLARQDSGVFDLADLEPIEDSLVGPAPKRPGGETSGVLDLDEMLELDDDVPRPTSAKPSLPRPAAKPLKTAPPRPPGGKPVAKAPPPTRRPAAPPPPSRPPAAPEPVPAASLPPPPPVASRELIDAVTAGLPPLPELDAPVLPARPSASSAWHELAHAYASVVPASKSERAGLQRLLARLWDEGAGMPEAAIERLEEALALVPDDQTALAGLVDLSEKAGDPERLIAALSRLLGDLTLPEHIVAYHLRLADLYEQTGQPERAEEQYRGVLAVSAKHLPALRSLAALHAKTGREREAAEASARLYDAEADCLTLEERIPRVLQLARDLAYRADRSLEAIRRLDALVKETPETADVHAELIEILQREGLWVRAVEALRWAAEVVPNPDARVRCLARAALLTEERLGQIDAAIATWSEVLVHNPGDPDALARLQNLYLRSEQYAKLLPVLDRRLAQVAPGDRDARIALLVVKARALQEGQGDEIAALETLETLAAEAPENDDVVLGLSRLYRKGGRLDDGIEMLRRRLAEIMSDMEVRLEPVEDEPLPFDIPEPVSPALAARRLRVAEALATALAEEAGDPRGALETLDEALAAAPPEAALGLQQRRVALARALGDDRVLAVSLAAVGEPDGILEAAAIARDRLREPELAAQLFTRVLAELAPGAPQRSRRLSQAIEGLVGLRLAAGDLDGADALLDAQLAQIDDPEIRARILTESGRALLRGGQEFARARRRFEAALAVDPDHAPARLALGSALIEAGLHAEAEAALEAAVEAFGLTRDQPRLVEGLLLLAHLFERTDRANEAYRRLSMALRHVPDDLEIRAAMAHNRAAAGRHRDAVAALEPVEQRLAAGTPIPAERAPVVADLLILAAECDAKQNAPAERLAARYARALELAPRHRKARAALAQLAQESGRLVDAAEHTLALAELESDPEARGRALLGAGMLFHEAAGAAAEAGEETVASSSAQKILAAAFEAVQAGLALIQDIPHPVVERRQLEAAFWTAVPRNAAIALGCLDRLLHHPDLREAKRAAFLLEGVRIALQRGEPGDPARALGYARAAALLLPDAAGPIHALVDALRAAGKDDEIEPAVRAFLGREALQQPPGDLREARDRQRLLVWLSDLVLQADPPADPADSRPAQAIRLLERAAELDPAGLGLVPRRQLARLYADAKIQGPQVRSNSDALLHLDPLDEASLAALARHCAETGERDRAHAIHQLLRIVSPGHAEAGAFLSSNELVSVRSGKLDPATVLDAAPADAGVVPAMTALWEGAAELLAEELPRPQFSEAAWIEAETDKDTLLWKVWTELGTQLPAQGVRLADIALIPDGKVDGGWVNVSAVHSPVILVGPAARAETTAPRLRFALGRALFFTRPAAILVAGLPRPIFAGVLAAALQAFHPRHTRRVRGRDEADLAARLGQTLARKLPIRLARQLSTQFKEREQEGFDSRDWRAWVQRSGDRVGLCLSRNLGAALDILGLPQEPGERSAALKARAAHDGDLRDLLVFAVSPAYVAARRGLGFEVKTR